MKNIRNTKNVNIEIAQKLIHNKPLVKMIIDDTPDLNGDVDYSKYTLETMLKDKYFSIYPATDQGIKDAGRNTYLIIVLDDIEEGNGSNQTLSGSIYVTTDADHVLLSGGKNRMLEICDLICQDLDEFKITASGKIHIESLSLVMIDYFRAAYRIQFTTRDQSSEKAEI